ncbi:hypothetical protein K070079E91_48440 [Eisenbergiella porci]
MSLTWPWSGDFYEKQENIYQIDEYIFSYILASIFHKYNKSGKFCNLQTGGNLQECFDEFEPYERDD